MSLHERSSREVEEQIACEVRAILEGEEVRPDAPTIDRFSRLLRDRAIRVSVLEAKPARKFVVDLPTGDARLVRWGNLRFNWAQVATVATEMVLAHELPHASGFWFVKAFQLFLKLRGALSFPVPDRIGLSYWGMWCSRDLGTNEITIPAAHSSIVRTFETWKLKVPSPHEIMEHTQRLEEWGCLVTKGDRITLREAVELDL